MGNEAFLKTALACLPTPKERAVPFARCLRLEREQGGIRIEEIRRTPLKKGDRLCLDFGDHQVGMVTPYLYHHYVQALLDLGEREKALSVLRRYWGGMVEAGADTFWELYNPDNPAESPYGGTIVNSDCHAWSCGPAWFLRKYKL